MTEHDEIAVGIAQLLLPAEWPSTLVEARTIIRTFMGEETVSVIDQTAEALMRYVSIRRG